MQRGWVGFILALQLLLIVAEQHSAYVAYQVVTQGRQWPAFRGQSIKKSAQRSLIDPRLTILAHHRNPPLQLRIGEGSLKHLLKREVVMRQGVTEHSPLVA